MTHERARGRHGRVVCGVDGSPTGWRALGVAAHQAALLDAHLDVVVVQHLEVPSTGRGVPWAELPAAARTAALRVVDQALRRHAPASTRSSSGA